MRICISGFFGWRNSGDEGILLAIIDSLGSDHEYIVSTSLPFTLHDEYLLKLPRLSIAEVREIRDLQTDYDLYLLGGGGLNWGFGWKQVLATFTADKPCINYGVGYRNDLLWGNPKLHGLYKSFLEQFDAITVRDKSSQKMLDGIGVASTLTMCPSINLVEEKFACPTKMVVLCPRFEDVRSFEENSDQIDWFVDTFKEIREEVLLIPFAPYDRQDNKLDLSLCEMIAEKMGGARILKTDGTEPRKLKYAISVSKLVVSGGRYHPLVWASTHNVPFQVYPKAEKIFKIRGFLEMHRKYGDKLKEMEKQNKETLLRVAKEHGCN